MLRDYRLKHSWNCNQLSKGGHSLQNVADARMSRSANINNEISRSLIYGAEKRTDQISSTTTNNCTHNKHPHPTFSQERIVSKEISHHYHPFTKQIELRAS